MLWAKMHESKRRELLADADTAPPRRARLDKKATREKVRVERLPAYTAPPSTASQSSNRVSCITAVVSWPTSSAPPSRATVVLLSLLLLLLLMLLLLTLLCRPKPPRSRRPRSKKEVRSGATWRIPGSETSEEAPVNHGLRVQLVASRGYSPSTAPLRYSPST